MSFNDGNWQSVVNAFSAAALGVEGWVDALRIFAEVTGSRCGELIGLGSSHSVPFNYISGMDNNWAQDFIAIDGGNPAVNPIVRAGTQCAVGTVLSSAEFLTKEERRSNPFVQEHAARYDFAHVCLTPLIKTNEMLIGLAVLRSPSQGEITQEQRRIFTSLAPHIRAAASTQLALEHQNILSANGALDSAHVTAFICDQDGRVRSMTSAAEEFLSRTSLLRIQNGILSGNTNALSQLLLQKIGAVIYTTRQPLTPADSTIPLKDSHGRPIMLEISLLPKHPSTAILSPKSLIIVRHLHRRPEDLEPILRKHYKLSSSETDVCLKLATGMSVSDISDARKSSTETVRKQLKSVFEKLDVHSQAELVSMVYLLS